MIKYRPGKLASKLDILSSKSGDSPWEGDMKHRQNHGRILLPKDASEALRIDNHAKVLQANTTETITLEIEKELLSEIQTLSTADKEMQEVRRKKVNGTTCDEKIPLGLCEDNSGLLIYDGLI